MMRTCVVLALVCACGVLTGCSGSTEPKEEDQVPAAVLSIDSATVRRGRNVELPVRLHYTGSGDVEIDSISGFDLLIEYNDSVLQVTGVDPGPIIS